MENSTKDKNIIKKKFTSWKVYIIVAVSLWLFSILMAGSILGDLIMAITTIPLLLAMIYIFIGIFEKRNRNILLKKGKEYFVTGVVLFLLHSVVYYLSSNSPAVKQVVYATNGAMGVITLLLIISGIICLIRGYILPKESLSNTENKVDQTTKI